MGEEPTYWRRDPPPHLCGLVSGYFAYDEGGAAMRGTTEPAGLDIPFIVNFGSPFEIALGRAPQRSDAITSFAAGLYAGPIVMNSDGGAKCIQVNLTPLGGRIFYQLPLKELANRMVTLSDLDDPQINQLVGRLTDLNDWQRRLDLVEQFVTARLAGATEPSSETIWALRQIEKRNGAIQMSWLCSELGWSRRRLAQTLRTEFGLTPKSIARIARFKHAEAMAAAKHRPNWADIATACYFSDQAHLTREFADLAGRTPTEMFATA